MSLRSFHLVFIGVSVILAAFVAAWAEQQYQTAHAAGYAVTLEAAPVAELAPLLMRAWDSPAANARWRGG